MFPALSRAAQRQEDTFAPTEYSLGLPTGTRLRARLESSASTAVRTPVLAVIEYNYERGGEIIVPAGAKAVGQIQEADHSQLHENPIRFSITTGWSDHSDPCCRNRSRDASS